MEERSTEQHQNALRALTRAQRVVSDVLEPQLMAVHGLSLTSYDVLWRLTEAPEGRLRLSELADDLALSRSGVSRLVDRLERAGLIRREQCPSDRRGSYATLTEAGREVMVETRPVHLRGIRDHLARRLSAREAATLAALLERIAGSETSEG